MPPQKKNGKSRLTTPWGALGPIGWGGDLTGTRSMSVTPFGFEPWTYGEVKHYPRLGAFRECLSRGSLFVFLFCVSEVRF